MGYTLHAGALVAAASGVAIGFLGLVVLRSTSGRRANLALGSFAVLWGVQLLAANLLRMVTDVPSGQVWFWTFLVLLIPLYIPLLYFVSAYPWPSNRLAREPLWAGILAVPAAVLLLLVVAAPELYVESIRAGSPVRVVSGPLLLPVSAGISVLAFAVAGTISAAKWRAAAGSQEKSHLGLLVAALLLYLSNRASLLPDVGILRREAFLAAGLLSYGLLLTSFLAAFAVVAYVAYRAYRNPDLPWRDLVLAAAVVPFTVSVLGALARSAGYTQFDTVGLWRLAMVAVLAYGVARTEMFDVEVRLREAAPAAAYVLVAALGLAVLWGAFGTTFQAVPALGAAASLGWIGAAVPTMRWSDGLLDRVAGHLDDPGYLYKRKIEVYQSALEESEARGMGEETEEEFLEELRRDLGISEREHQVLVHALESEAGGAGARDRPAGEPDRFQEIEELGRGTYGRAVLAEDEVLGREVVLKEPMAPWLLDEEGREEFLEEARLAAGVSHPNVVTIHDVVDSGDRPTLVLEHVEGGDLDDRLVRGEGMEPAEAVDLVDDVLAGLEAIHEAGIVHRDLKPGNVLVDGQGRAKVTDFGVAQAPADAGTRATLAATQGSHPGSIAYMSPEQAGGEEVDARSDLYAAGVLLYRCLTGDHYLDLSGADDLEARRRIREEEPDLDREDLPAGLRDVLERALAKDPGDRFPDAAAMRAALQEAPDEVPSAPEA